MRLRTPALTLVASILVAAGATPRPVSADTVLLKDSRILDCPHAEKQADGSWTLHFVNGDIVLPAAMVKEAWIVGAQGYEPKDDEEKAKLEKGLVPYEGEWIPKAERDAKAAKRAAEAKRKIEEAKAHREWRNRYKTKTANFEFEYTIPPDIAKGYIDLMETYYGVFTKQFNVSRPPKEKLKVCFYHDYETFLEVAGVGYGVLAYYLPGPRRELNFFYDRLRPDETTAIMFHEAQHYLSHLLDLKFWIPHNFSESFAEYYGGSHWDPVKKAMTTGGVQEGRLTEILADISAGEHKSLDKFLRNELGYDDYTWGWSFVHFMMETPKYAKKFHTFYVALPTAKDVLRVPRNEFLTVDGVAILNAFKKYTGIADIPALEKEWYEYIETKLKITGVYGLEEAAFSAMNAGRTIRAKRFFKEAIEKGSKNPAVFLRYGKLLEDRAEAIALFKKGLEIDPINPALYTALGSLTKAFGGAEAEADGKKLLHLAMELDPDDVETWVLVEDALEKTGPLSAPKPGEGSDGGDAK